MEDSDWMAALASKGVDRGGVEYVKEEWEAWCDPGTVVWRYGPWQWEDIGYELTPIKRGGFPRILKVSRAFRLAFPEKGHSL